MSQNKPIVKCRVCLEINKISLSASRFTCRACGHDNKFDREKFIYWQQVILKKLIGEKPEKPENN